jgi:hypothetical protein
MKAVLLVVAAIVLMFGISVAVGLATSRLRDRRLNRVAASRDLSVAFATYQAAFAELPEPFVRDSYALVQDLVARKDFPVYPTDNIWKTLELDQGNVEDKLETIFEKYPEAMELLRKATGPTDTVRDLVAFIYTLAQQGAPADVLTAASRQGRG